ncbi:MAG: hypothetical protein RBU23_13660, partial [Candidatus Auribacterota bacterium]|nr:hypothetical protein [Candidatus Auribacterota bacterium]
MKRYRGVFVPCLILFIIFACCLAYADGVPNAPSITEFGGKTVIAGETIYTNSGQQGVAQPGVLIKGSAPADTQITVYRNGVPSTQTTPAQIITGSDGKWSAVVTMATGQFNVTATASNQSGSSLPSQSVSVMLDTTAPTVTVHVRQTGWRTNNKYMYGHNNMYGVLSDSASGIDWSTATITVKNLTTGADIAGTQANNGVNQIDFYPTAGWGVTQVDKNRYRITVYARDRAGNETQIPAVAPQIPDPWNGNGWREYIYDSEFPPAPTIFKIWDPTHNVFTGTGEPSSNLPDAEGYVNYYPGMTVSKNPTRVKGKIVDTNGVPKVNYFNQDHHCWYVWETRYYPWVERVTTNNGGISLSTGEFIYTWIEEKPTPQSPDIQYYDIGDNYITFNAVDSAYLYVGTSIHLKFQYGTPKMPPMPSSPVFTGGEQKVLGSRIIPDTSGKINKMNDVQTVRIFFAPQSGSYWLGHGYNYSKVVLPQGWSYVNTTGVYDPGDIYSDTNNNNQYDLGEPFFDVVKPSVSDGESYTIYNFLSFQYPQNSNIYVKVAAVNQYGMSAARSLGRFHHRDIPPSVVSVVMEPKTSPYLSVAQKPTQIVVNVQNSGYDWAMGFYGLDQPASTIKVYDDNNQQVSTNQTTWTYEGSLKYKGTLNVSNIVFQPQKQYTVQVTARDLMPNQRIQNVYTFVIDTLAPEIVDIIPEPGSEIGRLPNFKANLWDTAYGELEGSGISFGNGDQAI